MIVPVKVWGEIAIILETRGRKMQGICKPIREILKKKKNVGPAPMLIHAEQREAWGSDGVAGDAKGENCGG